MKQEQFLTVVDRFVLQKRFGQPLRHFVTTPNAFLPMLKGRGCFKRRVHRWALCGDKLRIDAAGKTKYRLCEIFLGDWATAAANHLKRTAYCKQGSST